MEDIEPVLRCYWTSSPGMYSAGVVLHQ